MVDQPPLPPSSSPDRDALAAELALGLLDGIDRAEALRLCLSDPGFAAEVEAWSLRLSPLLGAIPAIAPSPHVWKAVEARIGGAQGASVVRSLRLWRGSALLSGALAASLALFITLRPAALQAPGPVAVSQLASTTGAATMAIAYDPQKGVLRLSPTALDDARKSPELWVIPGDGVPRSLGIIRADGRELAVDPGLRPFLKGGVTLAITLEDAATAPHKAPSTTPILTGKITII
ncbi:MAG TPA: anti-sigma factor [Sphingobium sp.]